MEASKPLMLLDSTHHGPWIVIITAIGLVVVLFSLCLRAYVRIAYGAIAGIPDLVFGLAGIIGVVQSCLVFWEVDEGLGTSSEWLTASKVGRLQQSFFASNVLYLVGIYLSKCCICFVYLQLTPNAFHNRASYALIGLATVWIISANFAIGIDCELNRPWAHLASQCPQIMARWGFITATDILIEMGLFALATCLVYGLQVPLKTKCFVVLTFGLRLLVVIPAAFRLHYLTRQVHSPNPTLSAAETAIWTSIHLHTSIVASVCYCFKSFVASVSTNYGGVAINLDVYNSMNHPSSLGRSRYGLGSRVQDSSRDPFAGPSGVNDASVVAGPRIARRSQTEASDDSQKVIIRKEVSVQVE